ncbi:TPA: restriction endonuclease subunit S [Providencia alcalifaciens]
MKVEIKSSMDLLSEGRWDIDYHLPAEGINKYKKDIIKKVSDIAVIVKEKIDPTKKPDELFTYVDISSVDVNTGTIINPQELLGEEAPSRARKVIRKNDIIISTCRPTRGAIAIVTDELDGQVASTGFSIIRCKKGISPIYIQYALKLDSTLEQFRKFSTGSSYPAILDSDVLKTKIPLPSEVEQKKIEKSLIENKKQFLEKIKSIEDEYNGKLNDIELTLIN